MPNICGESGTAALLKTSHVILSNEQFSGANRRGSDTPGTLARHRQERRMAKQILYGFGVPAFPKSIKNGG
jgi:hypothetical protein